MGKAATVPFSLFVNLQKQDGLRLQKLIKFEFLYTNLP